MKILEFPHPHLFVKCPPVTEFDEQLKLDLDKMYQLMVDSEGLGLSANQVGILKAFFVMTGPIGEPIYCINPKIEMAYPIPAMIAEGCLSAPGDFIVLNRSSRIVLSFQDHTGKKISRIFNKIHAVCAQHEIDHLLGKSFLQAEEIPSSVKKKLLKKWGIK